MRMSYLFLLLSMLLVSVCSSAGAQDATEIAYALNPGRVALSQNQYVCPVALEGTPEADDTVSAVLYDATGAEKERGTYPAAADVEIAFADALPTDQAELMWLDGAGAERCHATLRFDVIYAPDWQALAKATSEMARRYAGNVEPDDSSPNYASGRLIVKAEGDLPEIGEYRPVLTVIDEENHWYIQFERASDARACAEFLASQPGVLYAEADTQAYAISE